MKKILSALLIAFTIFAAPIFAGLVDAVSIVVNGQPITLYEIYKAKKSLGISKSKAVELLIKKRIKEAELKRLGVTVDDYDVNMEIERIAHQNGIDSLKMRSILAKEGVDWDEYKNRVKERLLQERLYRRILSTKIENPSEDTLKEYYRLHLKEFSMPEKIEVVEYFSKDKKALLAVIQNPLASIPGVSQKSETVNTKDLNRELLFMLTKTPKGQFTQIVPVGDGYVLFLIQDFLDQKPQPYEEVKQQVFAKWMEQKQQEAIESHFEKLRAAAKIKVVRAP
ncbi:MAG: peptidyl-prolyl cis-trans isomerase [Hydrogenimonas sp.]|nr:peptidyl-prolyl cis-trans isomerase [Hydrogenimonas sp.]